MTRSRPRKVPERTCVVCRTRRAKTELVRVALSAEGSLVIDETGKGHGRGAYVCRAAGCWSDARLASWLGHTLKQPLPEAALRQLGEFAATAVAWSESS